VWKSKTHIPIKKDKRKLLMLKNVFAFLFLFEIKYEAQNKIVEKPRKMRDAFNGGWQ